MGGRDRLRQGKEGTVDEARTVDQEQAPGAPPPFSGVRGAAAPTPSVVSVAISRATLRGAPRRRAPPPGRRAQGAAIEGRQPLRRTCLPPRLRRKLDKWSLTVSATPSAQYRLTIRVVSPTRPDCSGANRGDHRRRRGRRRRRPRRGRRSLALRDIIVDGSGERACQELIAATEAIDGVEVIDAVDRTFLLHAGARSNSRTSIR